MQGLLRFLLEEASAATTRRTFGDPVDDEAEPYYPDQSVINEALKYWYHSAHFRNISVLARTCGVLSLIGSLYIMQDILKSKERRSMVKNRVLFLMSTCDFLYSFARPILGTACFPSTVEAPGAMGTQGTCTLQGFVSFAAFYSTINYSVTLAITYLLQIVFALPEATLARYVQPLVLMTPLVVGLAITIPALPIQGFNPNGHYGCEFANWPPACGEQAWSVAECERGVSSGLLPWDRIFFIQVVVALIIIASSMLVMYLYVLVLERLQRRHHQPSRTRTMGRGGEEGHAPFLAQKIMGIQGVWYCGAFVLAFFPFYLERAMWHKTWVDYLVACSTNLLGFLNALVFIRPRFAKFRSDHPNESFCSSLRHTLLRTTPSTAGAGGTVLVRTDEQQEVASVHSQDNDAEQQFELRPLEDFLSPIVDGNKAPNHDKI